MSGGLRPDQAPPIEVVGPFFAAVPLAIVAGGLVLATMGSGALATPWAPSTLALAHTGTLGVLTMAMMGAMYQMAPVIAGAPIPWIRLAHGIHALFLASIAAFAWGLLLGPPVLVPIGAVGLGLSVGAFLAQLTVGLFRVPATTATPWGLRLAVLSLVLAMSLGLLLALVQREHATMAVRSAYLQVHLSLALLGWVGSSLVGVSFTVLPMFFLATPVPDRARIALLAVIFGGALLPLPALLALGVAMPAWAALPAAIAAWVVHPAWVLISLARRGRPEPDPALRAWQVAMGFALTLLPLAFLGAWAESPRWLVLFGWVAIFGWAGLVVHGMLTRIVPFVTWFHANANGVPGLPPMRRLGPQWVARAGIGMHVAAVLAGGFAIVSGSDLAARAAAVLAVGTGLALAIFVERTLRHSLLPGSGSRVQKGLAWRLSQAKPGSVAGPTDGPAGV